MMYLSDRFGLPYSREHRVCCLTDGTQELKEVQVRFAPRGQSAMSSGAQVPDHPLSVPVTLARYGLSEIVNHLASQGTTFRTAASTVGSS